jgi:hypothetical protein
MTKTRERTTMLCPEDELRDEQAELVAEVTIATAIRRYEYSTPSCQRWLIGVFDDGRAVITGSDIWWDVVQFSVNDNSILDMLRRSEMDGGYILGNKWIISEDEWLWIVAALSAARGGMRL